MREHQGVPAEVLDRLRSICSALPEVIEEQAWVGTRWCIRKRNFAHAVFIDAGWPPAYAGAARTAGPAVVLTFRSSGQDLAALSNMGHPFFRTAWFRDIVGVLLEPDTDWEEISELVTDSYCLLAPRKLSSSITTRPPEGEPPPQPVCNVVIM